LTLRVVIAGGTGSLGLAVAEQFERRGHRVTLLTRSLKTGVKFDQVLWDGQTPQSSWGQLLEGSILLNLAGELVDRVPTPQNVELLRASRVQPTAALVEAAKRWGQPTLWLQMSTLAIYGDAGDKLLDEDAAPAEGPPQMAGVAKAWESAASEAPAGRKVLLRTAIVLQPNSPALERLVTITRRFLGGSVGNGQQWVSWIHVDDFLNALLYIVDRATMDGIVHLTSPEPVRNKDLMRSLRRVLGRPWAPPTPAILVHLGARILFKTDPMLGLSGRRALPVRLLGFGFAFEYPNIDEALQNLLGKS
jgi:uncharacterized protein (TIGR01777 family)